MVSSDTASTTTPLRRVPSCLACLPRPSTDTSEPLSRINVVGSHPNQRSFYPAKNSFSATIAAASPTVMTTIMIVRNHPALRVRATVPAPIAMYANNTTVITSVSSAIGTSHETTVTSTPTDSAPPTPAKLSSTSVLRCATSPVASEARLKANQCATTSPARMLHSAGNGLWFVMPVSNYCPYSSEETD